MKLEISKKEAEMLQKILGRFIEETRSEIHHTDTEAYKEELEKQEQLVKELLEKIKT
jgi:hypothetical protein